jgi:hypothetical protein
MIMLSPRRYLFILALATLFFLGAIASVNYIVDPFQMNGTFALKGINLEKPYAIRNVRIAKAARVQRVKPVAIALGSSRADHGMNMDSPAWPDSASPRFNLGIPGTGVDELRAFLVHAADSGQLRLAVVGIEFSMFNTHITALEFRKDFDARVLAAEKGGRSWLWMSKALAETYVSTDTLMNSYRTLRAQGKGRNEYDLTGRFTEPFYRRRATCNDGDRMVFKKSGHAFLAMLETPQGEKDLSYRYHDGTTSFEHFARMLRFARKHGIELRLFISPGHLEELRIYRHQGYSGDVSDWKRSLVRILDEESREAGAKAFPLWDFSYLDSVTDEPVPAWGDTDSGMRWFWDHAHFKVELGERILRQVLSDETGRFGLRLTADTLGDEQQLADAWAERAQQQPVSVSEPGAALQKKPRPLECNEP